MGEEARVLGSGEVDCGFEGLSIPGGTVFSHDVWGCRFVLFE
jgi:hypothetical protein